MNVNAADAAVTGRREGRWRLSRLIVALGVIVLVLGACVQEDEPGNDGGGSEPEDRPTVVMNTDGDDESPDAGDGEGSDVPPKYVGTGIEDAHPDGSVTMVAYGQEPVAHMDALIEGELALSRGGCLGIESRGEGEFISVVWPYEYSVDVTGGAVQLLDENGDVVASEGEMIYMGGGHSPDPDGEIAESIPDECVADSYWMAGSEVRLVSDRDQAPDETPTPAGDSGNHVQTDDEALEQDARMYAEAHGVSVEEAMRRLELQQLPGPLQQVLMENEPKRFGGLYIEHDPEFRVVVQMTDGDEAAVRSYIDNPELDEIVEIETVDASYRDLEEAQREAMDLVQEIGVMASAGVNVKENRVEIYVSDSEMLQSAITERGAALPEHVVIGGEEQADTLDEN